MKKDQREAILISFLNEKEKYKKLGEYIVQLIQDDPSSPKESLHTIIYRIKDELRLIEKINSLNKELEAGVPSITEKDYPARVGDLLGVRIICLRLSDVEKIEAYIKLLSEENILSFVKGPDQKRSFILPVNPDDSIPDNIDLRYSGYSSIHYQIELGENSDAPSRLKGLLFELQLRTILEEAWSEIDHKYRYARSRIGVNLPEHIHMGFYNLSAYLQVAALQAEYLCRLAEAHSLKKIAKVKGIAQIPLGDELFSTDMEKDETCRKLSVSEIETNLEEILGVKVTLRTLIYIEKRLGELNFEEIQDKTLQQLLTQNRRMEFKTIFQEILNCEPFANAKERNIDVINALNFGIFYELQGKRVAQEGLRVVLRWRKDRSNC
ncbi:MAG: RelA/SpoT domain-containing protein [Deltaproteobacteria bacterium]|nr:RelA/SpoT domain-containing protein [Deltaproteobacteria bacterium]